MYDPVDRMAHLIYGMTSDQYDAGMRFDFEKVTTEYVGDGPLKTIRYQMPIIHADGTPWTMPVLRPVTTCILTALDKEPIDE